MRLRAMAAYCRRAVALIGAHVRPRTPANRTGSKSSLPACARNPICGSSSSEPNGSMARRSTIRRGLAHPSSQYIGTDFAAGDDVDVVADAHCLADIFRARHFDLVLSCSIYEHLARPWIVTNEIAKILRPGGWLFIQTHHSFPLHAYPNDYFRFSADGLKVFVEDAGLAVLSFGHSFPARIFSDRLSGLGEPAGFPQFLDTRRASGNASGRRHRAPRKLLIGDWPGRVEFCDAGKLTACEVKGERNAITATRGRCDDT